MYPCLEFFPVFCQHFSMTGKTAIKRLLSAATLLPLLALISCGSSPDTVMAHGTGAQMGTVSASVKLTEDRATGEIAGDTKNYGFFDKMPEAVSRQLQDNRSDSAKGSKAMNVAEKAYAIAVYVIIQQVRANGGDAVANVLSKIDRDYDMETKIETVTISITANAIKTGKRRK